MRGIYGYSGQGIEVIEHGQGRIALIQLNAVMRLALKALRQDGIGYLPGVGVACQFVDAALCLIGSAGKG